jgi:dihydroneopterin aldolase
MVSVELKAVRMHAYHGIYPGESEHGGEFEVSLTVTYRENPQTDFSDLSQLVDYSVLYELIHQRMMVPTPLIEKVAESIIRKVKHQYPVLHTIKLSIYKVSPPIPHFNGQAGVTIEKNYED